MSKEAAVVNALIERNMHIAFAESCTGGLCCAALVSVPDASRVLDLSFTTYANEAKIKYLGVEEQSIEKHGVVSEVVAAQMAKGVAAAAECEVGVGVTGIAGPTGGSDEKPVGTVCFGFYIDGALRTFKKHFGSIGRNEVRAASVDFVFSQLLDLLK